MTRPERPGGSVVPWLIAQAAVFGVMAALLGIVANAMFLDAYGAGWLPLTYIAIGIAGILISGAVARSARSAELVPIALVVLGAAAIGLAAAWTIDTLGDAPWVSVPLLVGFPILIQLGFVFIGGQAGRILDIAGIKANFPRIMAGFPIGAIAGGLLGGWIVALTSRVEDLLLATAIAQGAFTALVWATGRRFAVQLAPRHDESGGTGEPPRGPDDHGRPSFRALLARRFVALILAYQVFSALGSQLADFLVFDRAAAQYPDPADLAGFLAVYTAVMNIVSIAFLVIVAGPLLRRFGLPLGITANPVVLTIFAFAMLAGLMVDGGGASVALLLIVSAGRIADIALTDGTTRTAINATYQLLPERERLAVQTAIEGIGVPVAIGISGVLILALGALPSGLAATIAVTTIVCVVWTWGAVLLARGYGPALVDALRRRRWLDLDAALEATHEDEALAFGLLSSPDPRALRLGVDLLGGLDAVATGPTLRALADDPRPDVRMGALAALTASGDAAARQQLGIAVRTTATSTDPADRRRAARALEWLDARDRAAAEALLRDDDVTVRRAALDSVRPRDGFAIPAVLAALEEPDTLGAASGAVERLGDDLVPVLAERLGAAGVPAQPSVMRLVRGMAARTPARDAVLARHVAHRDRELGLAVVGRLADTGPSPAGDARAALDKALTNDVGHASRILAARLALLPPDRDADAAGGDAPIVRALADEWDLIRRVIVAGRLARHGSDRLGPAFAVLDVDGPAAGLAVEALGVDLDAVEAATILAVLDPVLRDAERLARLGAPRDAPTDAIGWLRDLIEDPTDAWRSPWLTACAIHAAAARGVLDAMATDTARRLGDPIVDEELDRASAPAALPTPG